MSIISVIIVIYLRQVEMPFGEGLDAGKGEVEWIVARDKPKYYANHLQNMHDIRVNNHCLIFQTPFEQLV